MFTLRTKYSMAKALITKNSPFYIQFYISKKCHLRCKMCNIVESNKDLNQVSLDKIEMIADNLNKIGAGVILLTGGEPFLHDDIDEIVKIFISKGLNIRLQTAGLITRKEKIKKCAELGAKDINVSLDSLDEELSDYINGVKHSWRKAIETISFISQNFPQKDSICALGCVLSPYNIDEIEAVLDFATEIGWWLSVVPVHITDTNSKLNFRGYDEYFKFNNTDFPKIYSLINNLKKKKRDGYLLFDSDDYLDSIYYFITNGRPSWRKNNICDTPNLYFAILPDGRFAPCCDHRLDEIIYVYDRDFPTLYKSKQFLQKVKEIAKNCQGCNFGSFPEMSLSVRSINTFFERLKIQYKVKKNGIKKLDIIEIYNIINSIKRKYSIYSEKRQYCYRERKYYP